MYLLTYYFLSLRPKYLYKHHVFKHLNVCEKVSYPYSAIGKVIVLYGIIFMFLDSKR